MHSKPVTLVSVKAHFVEYAKSNTSLKYNETQTLAIFASRLFQQVLSYFLLLLDLFTDRPKSWPHVKYHKIWLGSLRSVVLRALYSMIEKRVKIVNNKKYTEARTGINVASLLC